ncbi:hypothetical protein POPTR_002G208637v4 [Populus trichocarpa]|uniref:Uncharacterized protein n=1 Tax=Populus trichocarpa TaxID=3694 RepID=A0ACC0TFC2_POPTR|nr:hypothetical protein BDE02_02G189500 [Populus trichocarpa]KAI9400226.1 hypothetical protein POPTR_002G208637v4 [Populus trichocarpa]
MSSNEAEYEGSDVDNYLFYDLLVIIKTPMDPSEPSALLSSFRPSSFSFFHKQRFSLLFFGLFFCLTNI